MKALDGHDPDVSFIPIVGVRRDVSCLRRRGRRFRDGEGVEAVINPAYTEMARDRIAAASHAIAAE